MRATTLLKRDHAAVRKLFGQFGRTRPGHADRRRRLVDEIATELEVHAKVEEQLFYPVIEPLAPKAVREGEAEHDEIKGLLADVQGESSGSRDLDRAMAKLRNHVEHHVAEEESELFAVAAQLGTEHLTRLGAEMEQRQQELRTSLVQKTLRGVKKIVRKVA